MYIVILFVEEVLVDAVPVSWFNNGQCVWPSKSIEARKLIELKASPNNKKTFFYIKYKARKSSSEIGKCYLFSTQRTQI